MTHGKCLTDTLFKHKVHVVNEDYVRKMCHHSWLLESENESGRVIFSCIVFSFIWSGVPSIPGIV